MDLWIISYYWAQQIQIAVILRFQHQCIVGKKLKVAEVEAIAAICY